MYVDKASHNSNYPYVLFDLFEQTKKAQSVKSSDFNDSLISFLTQTAVSVQDIKFDETSLLVKVAA